MAVIFYIVASVAILGGLSVVLQRTPVYSALSLIVVLCALAVMYLLLNAPFIAVIQVIIYAGAIMVLFVLVIMLLNAGREVSSERSRFARRLGGPLLGIFLLELLLVVWSEFPAEGGPLAAPLDSGPQAIGALLFRKYVLPFELTSILILVAVLGAVVLAKRQI